MVLALSHAFCLFTVHYSSVVNTWHVFLQYFAKFASNSDRFLQLFDKNMSAITLEYLKPDVVDRHYTVNK